jgi:membrane protein
MNLVRFLPSPIRSALRLLGAMSDRMSEINIGLVSAGVAFYGLLAIFPTLTAVVALWGLFADPSVVAQEVQILEPMVPEEGFDILENQVNALASGTTRTLGWASAISLLGAFWASRSGVAAMIGALNKVHRAKPRGGIWHAATALMLSAGLILAALVALASVVIAPIVLALVPLGPFTGLALSALRWVVGIVIVLLAVGALYRFGPAAREADPRRRRAGVVTTGAVLAVALWGFVSWAFSTYLANFGNYDKVYGSLGAVIALLMWFYLSAFMVLLGAIFDVEWAQFHPLPPEEGEETDDAEESGPPEDTPDDTGADPIPQPHAAPQPGAAGPLA